MATVEVLTRINAPQARCFYLALSVDLHTVSAQQTKEKIIAGVHSGILQLQDSVTFRGRHFGVWQTLTSKITALQAPTYFRDDMQRGAFKSMWHEHYFEQDGATTLMRDIFVFTSPLGWLGKLVDALVLKRYMRQFLQQRGLMVKQYAESNDWQLVIPVSLQNAKFKGGN